MQHSHSGPVFSKTARYILFTGGQTPNPAFVSDIEKKSTFKNSRDGDRSDFSMRFG